MSITQHPPPTPPPRIEITIPDLARAAQHRALRSVPRAPGVERLAPCAEPVARECALDDGFDAVALLEARFAGAEVLAEGGGAERVVDVAAG